MLIWASVKGVMNKYLIRIIKRGFIRLCIYFLNESILIRPWKMYLEIIRRLQLEVYGFILFVCYSKLNILYWKVKVESLTISTLTALFVYNEPSYCTLKLVDRKKYIQLVYLVSPNTTHPRRRASLTTRALDRLITCSM